MQAKVGFARTPFAKVLTLARNSVMIKSALNNAAEFSAASSKTEAVTKVADAPWEQSSWEDARPPTRCGGRFVIWDPQPHRAPLGSLGSDAAPMDDRNAPTGVKNRRRVVVGRER